MTRPDPFGPVPPEVDLDEMAGWIVHEDDRLLVVDKPGWLVCHPSKRGPRSSLVGACREHAGLERLHLVSRLDRETSGLVVLAKDPKTASRLQTAVQRRQVQKTYLAVLDGALEGPVEVDAPLGPHPLSRVRARVAALEPPDGKPASTRFEPLEAQRGPRPSNPRDRAPSDALLTLARVLPRSGRKHQIRAHAAHIGHSVAGDKIYGPDETLFLEFIERGWTERLAKALPIRRQALHLARLRFRLGGESADLVFEAALPQDMRQLVGSAIAGAAVELAAGP